jgi:hypothetical protein
MRKTNPNSIRLVVLIALAAFQLGRPKAALADGEGPCNTFCWTICNEVQGSWCTGTCGNMGLICAWGSPCSSVNLFTVTCWGGDT